jgi:hypothetical protein
MKTVIEKHFGVTLAFAAGSSVIVALLVALDAAGAGGDWTRGVDNWSAVGRSIIGTAALAGIVVDALRWIGVRQWSTERKFRLPIRKIIKQNLA